MFKSLRSIFKDAADKISESLTEKVIQEKDLEDVLWELEVSLLENNVALDVVEQIKAHISKNLVGKSLPTSKIKSIVYDSLKEYFLEIVEQGDFDSYLSSKKPFLIVFYGFNGAGKTTTIAKIAHYLKHNGYSVVLAAGDTFRAAAIEQLEEHGKKLGVKVIKHNYGSDSAAVIYDAVEHAKANNIDFVLADTAGRNHLNKNLLEELKKIIRVNNPDLSFLVIDSTSGSEVVAQVESFKEVGFDGYVMTKYDVDKSGGTIINASNTFRKPVFFLGVGQKYEDLEKFDKAKFIDSIVPNE